MAEHAGRTSPHGITTMLLLALLLVSTTVSTTARAAAPATLTGTYRGHLPATDAARRTLTLVLLPDGAATFSTEYLGKANVVQRASWERRGNEITLTYQPTPDAPATRPITFRLHGQDLVPLHWDANDWGAKGPPVLHRLPPPR